MEKTTYSYFIENRYSTPEFIYNKIEYSSICNNGFIKLYTEKTKAYWLAQNELGHLTYDWKFHISIEHNDVSKAWDIIAAIFLDKGCRSGMKVVYLKENHLSAKGREITIYILKYDNKFKDSLIANEYSITKADEHSEDFWTDLIEEIEISLFNNNIKSNGLALGDYPIGNYTSIRNEAFVYDKKSKEFIYPPDNTGWNATGMELPFDLNIFKTKQKFDKVKLGFYALLMLYIAYIINKYFLKQKLE